MARKHTAAPVPAQGAPQIDIVGADVVEMELAGAPPPSGPPPLGPAARAHPGEFPSHQKARTFQEAR